MTLLLQMHISVICVLSAWPVESGESVNVSSRLDLESGSCRSIGMGEHHACPINEGKSIRSVALNSSFLNPISGLTTPEPPECSFSTDQGRGRMMDCPLTNQGQYTLNVQNWRETCKRSSQSNLGQSHEGLQPLRSGGDWV